MILSLSFAQSTNKFPTIKSSHMEVPNYDSFFPLPVHSELILNNVLEYLPLMDAGRVFKICTENLPGGGRLYIAGNDCSEMARYLHIGGMNIQVYNELTFGGRQSAFSLITLKGMMEQVGLKVMTATFGGIGNCEYYIIGQK